MLSEDERSQLTSIARSRSISTALVTRAPILLVASAGKPDSAIAPRLQLPRATVGKRRILFLKHRIKGLYDEVRPGKPRTIDDERLARLIHKILHTKPADGSTQSSVRTIVAETDISPTSAHRYFKLMGLQPRRSESFKRSTDQFLIEKLREVVGLYVSSTENALVLRVEAKGQCQALERRQPLPPMGFGYVGTSARLRPPRHIDTVRRLERTQWRRARHLQTASSASGVPVVPARDRQGHTV